jgi:5-methylthioadenosine/S-adenosylhomocysteine deaminase
MGKKKKLLDFYPNVIDLLTWPQDAAASLLPHLSSGSWAITPSLAGIHCVALQSNDYKILSDNGGAMIWSPLSNLLLYGKTANIKEAKDKGVLIGTGSDWSPSGSKNLLCELKVARLVSASQGGVFKDSELVAMATRNAAKILKWDKVLGSIESGKSADLLILSGRKGDPYAALLEAREKSIILVIINGVPRYGSLTLMKHFGKGSERLKVGNSQRMLNLKQETADPAVGELKLKEAKKQLRDGLARLPELAKNLEQPGPKEIRATAEPQWFLLLEHDEPEGVALRPHLPLDGMETARLQIRELMAPLSEVLVPLDLDPLTVTDDRTYLDRLANQPNLIEYVKNNLPSLY